jgi:transaldolase
VKIFIDTVNVKEIADIATVPFSVIEQLIEHPPTDIGIQKFLDDWKKVPK